MDEAVNGWAPSFVQMSGLIPTNEITLWVRLCRLVRTHCRGRAAGRWTGRCGVHRENGATGLSYIHDGTSTNWEESTCITKATMMVGFSIHTISREKLWHCVDNEC